MTSHSNEAKALRRLLALLEQTVFLDFDDDAFIPSEEVKRRVTNAVISLASEYDPYVFAYNPKTDHYEMGLESESVDLGDMMNEPEEDDGFDVVAYLRALEQRVENLARSIEQLKNKKR